MMFRNDVVLFSLLVIALTVSGCGASRDLNGFKMPKMSLADEISGALSGPIDGVNEQAEGFYSEGKLADPVSIENLGFGYMRVFVGRDSSWTTHDMAQMIRRAAAEMALQFPDREPLQLGDLSGHHGGQLLGHASHQNGLDADIKFFSKNGHVQTPQGVSTGFDESYVKHGKLTDDFDLRRNWALLKSFIETGRVARIFVDGVIKQGFCNYSKLVGEYASQSEALRRLRPLTNHDDHMHVRITCPKNSPRCETQSDSDIAPGTGC